MIFDVEIFMLMSRSLLLVPTNSPRPALAAELRHKDRVLVTALVAEPRHSHGRRRTVWLTHASRGRGAGRGRQRGQGGIRRRPTRHPHLGIVLAERGHRRFSWWGAMTGGRQFIMPYCDG